MLPSNQSKQSGFYKSSMKLRLSCFVVLFAWTATFSSLPASRSLASQNLVIDFDDAPSTQFLDRWMYPFNATPGQRIQAPTFSAIAEEMFDERDGQFLLALNTEAAGIPKGLSPAAYAINRLSLQLTEAVGEYPYDATFDDYKTHLLSGPLAAADLDAGRPLELYGAGFRNGFAELGWPDGAHSTTAPVFSAGSPFGKLGKSTRNVFAADSTGADVSNSFDSLHDGVNGYNTQPFAIGLASQDDQPLAAGSLVPAGAVYRFDVDVRDPAILTYVQEGLSRGQLAFVVTSMHTTGELGQGAAYPNLATANHFAFAGPQFEIQWEAAETTPGDFNSDGQLSSLDIDLLSSNIRQSIFEPFMDLDTNQQLDATDRQIWLTQFMQTNFGDANLDRLFNSLDLILVFQAGQYEDGVTGNSGWSNGDWDGDGEFNSADFLIAFQAGEYERTSATAVVIPEPSALGLLGLLIPLACSRRIQRKPRQR